MSAPPEISQIHLHFIMSGQIRLVNDTPERPEKQEVAVLFSFSVLFGDYRAVLFSAKNHFEDHSEVSEAFSPTFRVFPQNQILT